MNYTQINHGFLIYITDISFFKIFHYCWLYNKTYINYFLSCKFTILGIPTILTIKFLNLGFNFKKTINLQSLNYKI